MTGARKPAYLQNNQKRYSSLYMILLLY